MPKFEKDLEMPNLPEEKAPTEEEELDLFEGEEKPEKPDLAAFSDDDLIAELEKRGFEVETEEMQAEEEAAGIPEEEEIV